jgi:hypothetical protein
MATLGFNTQRSTSQVVSQHSPPRYPSAVQKHLARNKQQVGFNLQGFHCYDFLCFPQKLYEQLFKDKKS